MITCERCSKKFTPQFEDITLCDDCCNDIIAEHEKDCPASVNESESDLIINGVMEILKQGDKSEVQALLESPGVGLTLARLVATGRNDVHMLAMNCFRVGAYVALKQANINHLLNT